MAHWCRKMVFSIFAKYLCQTCELSRVVIRKNSHNMANVPALLRTAKAFEVYWRTATMRHVFEVLLNNNWAHRPFVTFVTPCAWSINDITSLWFLPIIFEVSKNPENYLENCQNWHTGTGYELFAVLRWIWTLKCVLEIGSQCILSDWNLGAGVPSISLTSERLSWHCLGDRMLVRLSL